MESGQNALVFPSWQDADNCVEHPYQAYLMRCLEFAVAKGLLMGMAGHYRQAFGNEHVVKLAQCLAKPMEHDSTPGGTLNFKGLAETECVAALLKN